MIISNVNIGSGPGANDGESIYSAFYKVNQNFANVQSNVNSLTNSVSSVAGRTGNVTLTINDIVGLNTSYAVNSNVTQANIGMKGYVDAKIAANVAALIDSAPGVLDTLNELAAALNDDASFSTTILNTVTLANTIQSQQIASANIGIIGYIDLANTIQSAQVGAANLAIIAANLGMKGYVDSVATLSIYGNANVASYLPTYGGNIKVTGIINDGNAIHLYNTLHIQGDESGNGLFVGDPDVEITPYGNAIASFHGNVNAPVYLNVHNKNSGAQSVAGIVLTSDIGDTSNDSLIMIVAGSNYNDPLALPNVRPLDCVIDSTLGNLWIGTVTKTINFYSRNYSPGQANLVALVSIDDALTDGVGNLNIHKYVDLNFLDTNSKIRFGDGSIQTTAYTGYGNAHVGAYTNLSTYAYNANVTAANLGMKGYVDSVASQSIYGNANVLSYLTQFDGNIIPSANVAYSLGNVTNRWKDLYLSGNTIFLGDSTISTEGGRLVTSGAAISPPTGAVAFANVQFEAATNFDQIRSYYVDNNFGYTANLKTWTTAPIVWDELRSAKIKINSSIVAGSTPDFASLDTSGGRFANAVATLDATGNIASLSITDGGVGYDAYYPYYAADSTGYDSNYIGQSYTGSPTGKSFRRIGLIPTTGTDIGNITSIGSFTRYSDLPTVGTNSYTWTGNTGTTISFTVDWASNTVTAYTYTPALPALTSAQDWQNWILDYQSTNDYGWIIGSGSITGGGGSSIQAVYDYLNREALPNSLTYDESATTWYPGNLLVNNSATVATLSSSTFFVEFNRTSVNYATLENSYGNPVYWSRGLSADTGISSGGDMTVAGDLRVAGDLYVSPTSIYMGDLRISAADGNLKVNTGIKFSDDSVQSTAYSNVQVAAYLTANPPASSYGNVEVGIFTNLSNYAYNANVTEANVGLKGYVDSLTYSNVQVATYLPTYTGNISAGNITVPGTSGKIGFSSGGFVQQTTSNTNGVTSHTTSGNIQLMNLNLGTNSVHTVALTNNKLTTNDIIVVNHILGGTTSVVVDAYVISDGLALIWIRDITGGGTGNFTPMLKYAVIQAPSS